MWKPLCCAMVAEPVDSVRAKACQVRALGGQVACIPEMLCYQVDYHHFSY